MSGYKNNAGDSGSYVNGYGPNAYGRPDEYGMHEKQGEASQYYNDSRTVVDNTPYDEDKQRGIMDHFYKKPDPNYSGTYGTDYEPKFDVRLASYGYRKYKKSKERKDYEMYYQNQGYYPQNGGYHAHGGGYYPHGQSEYYNQGSSRHRGPSQSMPEIHGYEDTYPNHQNARHH
ncbi:hypothetical protein GGI07_002429 [Coemansia sp. Benny D115]|nr:hypothetical protein GGI07_002429 [Coemansia sp. Benny D115]